MKPIHSYSDRTQLQTDRNATIYLRPDGFYLANEFVLEPIEIALASQVNTVDSLLDAYRIFFYFPGDSERRYIDIDPLDAPRLIEALCKLKSRKGLTKERV
jgi:hypothetical protein